jgi:hypothetical protein
MRRRVLSIEALFLSAESLFNAGALTYAQFRSVRRKLTFAASGEGAVVIQRGSDVQVWSVAQPRKRGRK